MSLFGYLAAFVDFIFGLLDKISALVVLSGGHRTLAAAVSSGYPVAVVPETIGDCLPLGLLRLVLLVFQGRKRFFVNRP